MEKKKIVHRKKYTVEIIYYSDGFAKMKRMNNGFPVTELLGILRIIENDLLKLFTDNMKRPDEIKRISKNAGLINPPSVP